MDDLAPFDPRLRSASRGRRTAWGLAQITLAAISALGLAEGAVRLADDNALFTPAIFVPDAVLGVRLRPDHRTRLKRRSGAVSVLSVGADGRRIVGADCTGAPTIVIVGDSQALGYHVNDREVFAARLQSHFGDAACLSLRAVPTYGPSEYRRVLDDAAQNGPVDAAVVLLTAANDWQERPTRNVMRTTAQYGFAAHASRLNAPPPARPFDWRTALADALKPLTPYLHLAVYAQRGRSAHAAPGPRVGPERTLAWAATHSAPVQARAMMDLLDGAAQGAPLFVLSLPLDIEVHKSHAAKYRGAKQVGGARLDALAAFHDALQHEASRRGATPISLHEPLRALGADAFFSDDDHLTPAGHQALADALIAPLEAVLHPRTDHAARSGSLP